MVIAVFRRRLKPGMSFDDFIAAWQADEGFGVPARVFNAVSLEDPREILSVGFVDIDAATLESVVLHTFYDLRSEHDFSSTPQAIDLTSAASLLSTLRSTSGT